MSAEVEEIKQRLTARLEDVIGRFWSGWIERDGSAFPEPGALKGDLGSFQVYLRDTGRHRRGDWFRRSAGIGGDVLHLISYGATGGGSHKDFSLAMRVAREILGILPDKSDRAGGYDMEAARAKAEKAREEAEQQDRKDIRIAEQMWGRALSITDRSSGWRYLSRRGIRVDQEPDLSQIRVLSKMLHPGGRYYPALVCRVQSSTCATIAVWRIFVTEDGGKAPEEAVKLGWGRPEGGAVRIGGIAETIAVCEGVETALAVRELTGWTIPVWSGLATAGIMNMEFPPTVKRVLIYPDGDRPSARRGKKHLPPGETVASPGMRAAMRARDIYAAKGLKAEVQAEPEPPDDYLDLLVKIRALEEAEV